MNPQDRLHEVQLLSRQWCRSLGHNLGPSPLNQLQIDLKQSDGNQQYDSQQQLQVPVQHVLVLHFYDVQAVNQNGNDQDQRDDNEVEHERRAIPQKSICHRIPLPANSDQPLRNRIRSDSALLSHKFKISTNATIFGSRPHLKSTRQNCLRAVCRSVRTHWATMANVQFQGLKSVRVQSLIGGDMVNRARAARFRVPRFWMFWSPRQGRVFARGATRIANPSPHANRAALRHSAENARPTTVNASTCSLSLTGHDCYDPLSDFQFWSMKCECCCLILMEP